MNKVLIKRNIYVVLASLTALACSALSAFSGNWILAFWQFLAAMWAGSALLMDAIIYEQEKLLKLYRGLTGEPECDQ